MNSSRNATHPTHSHVISTCARAFPPSTSPSPCGLMLPKYPVMGLRSMSGLEANIQPNADATGGKLLKSK